MLDIDVPGFGALRLRHLVLDFNGTLAIDGRPLPGVRSRLTRLAGALEIHVLTADTFGKARTGLKGVPCSKVILDRRPLDRAKASYVRKLGARRTVCIGNGRNDRLMLGAAALGIAVVEGEGAAGAALDAADVVVTGARQALDLLLRPKRLLATLRN
jgi:soluble P-type ATPase